MATYPTTAPNTTLTAIQQKVRRLVRAPSEAQLTEDQLNNYINTVVLYDFPEHLRTFQLRQPYTFWCNPYQSTYQLDIQSFGGATNAGLNQLYDFQNRFLTIHGPVYIAGYLTAFTQDRQEFQNSYPNTNFIQSIGVTGDGITTTFSGVISTGGSVNSATVNNNMVLLKRNVMFSSIDSYGNGITMIDVPVLDATTGVETVYGNLYPAGQQPTTPAAPPVGLGPIQPPLATSPYISGAQTINLTNYVNYVTGEFVVTFPVAPGAGVAINSQTVPTIPGRPYMMLYMANTITLRPVPDQPYAITFEVDARPTQLFQQNSTPELNELWQYIALLTARKILMDRLDLETVQLIQPELDEQQALCLRRTLVQITNSRAATVYSGTTTGQNDFNQGFGAGFF